MRKLLFVFAISFCIPFTLFAQNRIIKGNVTDDNDKPAVSVNVTVKNNKKEIVQTDKDGNFSISVKETGPISLVFSSAEFESKTVAVTDDANVAVKLKQSITTQDEVIVVGYDVVKKKYNNLTVSTVDKTQLKDIPVNSAAEALTGRLSGVQVTSDEGQPGSDATITVRGRSSVTQDGSPLYIVDGVRLDDGLNAVSPQDIDNVVVLKDAAATAIYGASGANGVILITTKNGKNTKGKATITYNGQVGYSELPKELGVLSPFDFVAYQWERDNFTSPTDSSVIRSYALTWAKDSSSSTDNSVLRYKNINPVDWQHLVLGRKAFQQTHSVSISGGTDITQYNMSFTDNEQDGIMVNTGFKRKLASFKLDQKLNDKAKAGFSIRFNDQDITGSGTSDPGTSSLNNLRYSIRYSPVPNHGIDYYDPTVASETSGNSLTLLNPLLVQQQQYRKSRTTIVNLSGYLSYNIAKFLTFKSTFGYDINTQRQDYFDDTITINSVRNASQPVATINTALKTTYDNSNVLSFDISKLAPKSKFNQKNDLTGLIGQELYLTDIKATGVTTKYFPKGIDAVTALENMNIVAPPAGASPQPYPTASEIPSNVVSFFAKVNYAYDKKYLLSASWRADGTSKFAPGHQWGYFPAVSASWKIGDEDFMKKYKFINDMKFRASIGEAGNNRVPDFAAVPQYTGNIYYGLNGQLVTAYSTPLLVNPDLTWETTVSRNVGLDLTLFNNRFNFTTDVYSNRTTHLLINNPSVPDNSGFTSQYQNLGVTTNKGVEFQVSALVIKGKKFNWNANFNISFNKNKIVSIGNIPPIPISSGAVGNSSDFVIQPGTPVGSMYGYVSDGFYTTSDFTDGTFTALKQGVANDFNITGATPKPGLMKLKKLSGVTSGDSMVSTNDRTIIGNPNPKFFGGLNQQMTLGGFDFSVFINFSYGGQVLNANKIEFTSGYTPNANLLSIMKDRWTNIDANGQLVTDSATLASLNQNAKVWSPFVGNSANASIPVSWAIEDASFIRINNITLGYTFPAKMLKRIKVSKLRVFATVNNVAVITSYSGFDPEVNTRRSTPATPSVDYSAYPRSRTYLAGVNLSFN